MMLLAVLLAAACEPAVSPPVSPTTSFASPSAAAKPPAASGLLVEIRAASHPTFDRLVLEFGGDKAPEVSYTFVDAVTEDPSDKPVPLQGKVFVQIVCQGAFLDTSAHETDPTKAQKYTGPKRITPGLRVLKEVAISGDFEAVLSFGVGLSHQSSVRVETLASPARVVFDFGY
jgi:hypothetical protein